MSTQSAEPRLTAIVPIRNRSGVRLENCLHSLRWQEGVDHDEIEIVISDFGSDDTHRASIDALAETYNARVVYMATDEVWNRSKVLNIGIQASRGQIAFCTDVDMIFAPNFLKSILDTHQAGGEKVMALCRCHDMPESIPEKRWTREDYEELQAASEIRQTSGTGACQAAPRRFFEKVQGYDEKFLYWGAEDNDMCSRAERYGLKLIWMDGTAMLHQWHPTMKNDRRLRFHINRLRYKMTKHVIVKNKKGWGAWQA